MPEKPTILKKTIVAKSRLFSIESLDLEFSNGARRNYERLARSNKGGAVLIIPMLDENTVLLIREYAAGVHRYELGLPKGKTEANESSLLAANRELKEEIGYGSGKLQQLTTLSLAPGYLGHMTDIILAQDLYPEKLPGDEPEELEVIPWNLNDISELLSSGECTEARSIAALFIAQEYFKNSR